MVADRSPLTARTWNRRALRFDVTLPTVSESSGRRARRLEAAEVGYRTALAELPSAAELVALRATGR